MRITGESSVKRPVVHHGRCLLRQSHADCGSATSYQIQAEEQLLLLRFALQWGVIIPPLSVPLKIFAVKVSFSDFRVAMG